MTCRTGYIATGIASDKDLSKNLLASMGVPVPKGFKIYNIEELEDAIYSIGFPVAIKPLDSNHGKGISANIISPEDAKRAFESAKNIPGQ